MRNVTWTAVLAMVLATAIGCGDEKKEGPIGGGTAIGTVDLNRVLQETGVAVSVNNYVRQLDQGLAQYRDNQIKEINAQIEPIRKDLEALQKLWQEEKDEAKKESLKAQFDEKNEKELQPRVRLAQAINDQAVNTLRNYGQLLNQEYQKALEPVLARVADSRKLGVILFRNPAQHYTDPGLDVTSDVLRELIKSPIVLPPPQQLRIDLPSAATQPAAGPTETPAPGAGER